MNYLVSCKILRDLIYEYEEKYHTYAWIGWDTEWVSEVRHALIAGLQTLQIKNFNRD